MIAAVPTSGETVAITGQQGKSYTDPDPRIAVAESLEQRLVENGTFSVSMELTRDDKSTCQITLLRDQEWLDVQDVNVGETITMDLPEMSVCGDAKVVSVEPTEIKPGSGRLVTGAFAHSSGDVHNLHIAGEAEPIGVTSY